jgi:hypothetical protein
VKITVPYCVHARYWAEPGAQRHGGLALNIKQGHRCSADRSDEKAEKRAEEKSENRAEQRAEDRAEL